MTDSLAPPDDILWANTVEVAALSDIGMRRSNNQDSYRVVLAQSSAVWNRQGHLFIVADGMGAHAAGELASRLAVDLIPQYYYKFRELPAPEALVRSFEGANADIYRKGQSNFQLYSMGTTCSGLALLPEGAVVVHVGDSRVYQLDGDTLYQLTFDHSLVWEMQAAGRVSEEAIRSGLIPKNVITRSIGPGAEVQTDLEGPFPARKGNRFLLCSDGLSGPITDDEIAVILKLLPPKQAAQFFVDLANLRGGPDNITAVVVEVTSDAIAADVDQPVLPSPLAWDKPFPRALAIAGGVCLAIALALAFLGQIPIAIIVAIAGAIALGTGAVRYIPKSAPSAPPSSTRYGAGPHRRFPVKATESFFADLLELIKQYRELADEKGWVIDWTELDPQYAAACRYADARGYPSAIRAQAAVIMGMVDQVRRQTACEKYGDTTQPPPNPTSDGLNSND